MKKFILLSVTTLFTFTIFLSSQLVLSTDVVASDFRPKVSGAPSRRVGGGTRGINEMIPFLVTLAPENTGETTNAQPTLYWYVSRIINKPFKFTITKSNPVEDSDFDPLLEVDIKKLASGIQSVSLAEHNISLQPDVEYDWSIAIVMDTKRRSNDITATGTIKLVESADKETWYDNFASLSSSLANTPDNKDLIQQREVLIKQVGLDKYVLNK